MKLSAHFTLKEFTDSEKALELGIDNSLPDELLSNAQETADMLERIRAYLSDYAGREVPIEPSSGYRCLALNRALKSRDTSDHLKALACDFRAPEFGTPYEICRVLAPVVSVLRIGQLIFEHTWVHVGVPVPESPVNRILTLAKGGGYEPGILTA